MSGSIKIIGIDKLQKKLKQNASLETVKKIVKVNGAEMHRNTQKFAPVDTAFLKRHIMLHIENAGMQAVVKGGADYNPYQEYGTRFMAGTPHFSPAYKIQVQKFKSDMKKVIK